MLTQLLIGTQYPTYQVFVTLIVAGLITALLMPPFIRLMRKDGIGQQVRADGPQTHLVKQGTPTMGGVIILAGVLVTCVLFAQWTPDMILCVVATIATGLLGLLDDIESVSHGRSLGLTPAQKMVGLIVISVTIWHNCYPASIFMGDTGSLALGAGFAALAVLTKTEVTSLVMGGLFIVEALSVMMQVVSFHFTGKRIFLMAPLHHHFEKKGWSETKVVIRFWIVSAMFAAVGFALYFQLR